MKHENFPTVTVVGAGLAGCEAALQLAARGVPVRLVEMRPRQKTPVHRTDDVAELVCSNSLKSKDASTAAGSLKYELGAMGSQLLAAAWQAQVAAGGALAVDRGVFSHIVQRRLEEFDRIEFVREECTAVPEGPAVIATGPLTSDALAQDLQQYIGQDSLAFYDAAAPIIEADSIDRSVVFEQSRYGKGGASDYLNAPFTKEEYEAFVHELVDARRVIERDFERRELFAACQPIEEVARTGVDALSHGALKPVGLTDPRTGKRPWAVVQLRAENAACTAYNLVGFQTNLRFGEQERVFRMVPGLEHAEFSRYGVMHRNTFLDTPHVLTRGLALPGWPEVHFAGQVTGTEGYLEAVASGLYVALVVYAELAGLPAPELPKTSLFGCLVDYATNPETQDYQPMHVNYGIIEPIVPKIRNKRARKEAHARRAHEAVDAFVAQRPDLFVAALAGREGFLETPRKLTLESLVFPEQEPDAR